MGKTWKKVIGVVCALFILGFNASSYVQNIGKIPSNIHIAQGSEKTLELDLPYGVQLSGEDTSVLRFNGQTLSDVQDIQAGEDINIQSTGEGSAELQLNVLGIIPIKKVTVESGPDRMLIPGGQSIGVAMYTKGALVVGTSEVQRPDGSLIDPAKEAGLLPGDIILQAGGVEIKNSKHLSEMIDEQQGRLIPLRVERDNRILTLNIAGAEDISDGVYRLGIWVRDSTAGVGTLTFFDPETDMFGSLGHAISDVDTHEILRLKQGEIIQSDIIDVKRGTSGHPGEIRGSFSDADKRLGRITINSDFGIFGEAYAPIENNLYTVPLPVAGRDDVELGPAKMLTTIDENGIQAFDIEIMRANPQNSSDVKSMVVRVTDERLLQRTGGIIQGMSGSPIIQNGHIIGAVTHVMVNDPTRGYGLYIDWMLEQLKN